MRNKLLNAIWKHRLNEVRGFKRPEGNLAVSWKRTGVEPASGLTWFLPLWAFTRLRWQFRTKKTWSVEVHAPGRFRNVLTRCVFEQTVPTRDEAWALAQRVADQVESGTFDHYLRKAEEPSGL